MANKIFSREMVVYVLGLLGGESRKIHTEDIAIKCHSLFPDSFSWTKYPEIPDKDDFINPARHSDPLQQFDLIEFLQALPTSLRRGLHIVCLPTAKNTFKSGISI